MIVSVNERDLKYDEAIQQMALYQTFPTGAAVGKAVFSTVNNMNFIASV